MLTAIFVRCRVRITFQIDGLASNLFEAATWRGSHATMGEFDSFVFILRTSIAAYANGYLAEEICFFQ